MNCSICGSPNPEGRVSCIVCRAAFALALSSGGEANPKKWLTERLRRTFWAFATALISGAIALGYFLFLVPNEADRPTRTMLLAVLCGALVSGGLLFLVGPPLLGGFCGFFSNLRLAARNRLAGRKLERAVRSCRRSAASAEESNCLAVALFLKSEMVEAQAVLERALQKFPEEPALLHNRAVVLAARMRIDEALEYFRKALQLGADPALVEPNIALALYAGNYFSEAAEACRQAWGKFRKRSDLLNPLVISLSNIGQMEEAMAHLQSGLSDDPSNPDFHINLGVFRFQLGDLQGAQEEFLNALRYEKTPGWAHHNAGICHFLRGHGAEAREQFSAAVKDGGGAAPTRGQLAILHHLTNQSRRAEEELRQALHDMPLDYELRHNLALLLFEQGRNEESLAEAERAVVLRPEEHDALVNAAAASFFGKRYRHALDHSLKAVQLYPESALSHFNYALSLEALERYEESKEHLTWLKARYPGFTAAINNLGVVFLLSGQTIEAIECFTRANELAPEEALVRMNLALTYYIQGDLTATQQELQPLLRGHSDLPVMLDLNGHLHSEQKRAAQAIEAWAKLLPTEPTNMETMYNLALAYYRNDQVETAIGLLRKVLLLLPRAVSVNNALGLAYAKNKAFTESLHHLNKVLDLQPDNPIAHSNMGLVQFFHGAMEKAMYHWQEVSRLAPAYAARREATRLSAYDDSEMSVYPINARLRAVRYPPLTGPYCLEPRFALQPPRYHPIIPSQELEEIWALQDPRGAKQ